MNISKKEIYSKLKKHFNYNEFRKGQYETIRSICNGKNTLSILPTGTGKSICFQIPAVLMKGTALVIVPYRSLMKDQVDNAKKRGFKISYYNGELKKSEKEECLKTFSENDLFFICPESVDSFSIKEILSIAKISMIVIDEAHSFGQADDFRTSYKHIDRLIKSMEVPVLALTATCTKRTTEQIKKCTGINDYEMIVGSPFRENLNIRYINVQNSQHGLLEEINCRLGQTGIIYCTKVSDVDHLYNTYSAKFQGHNFIKYHGKMSDKDRIESQNEFMNNPNSICFATKAFGTGIDKSDIRFIIHLDFVESMLEYMQQIGRGGRDGKRCDCILLHDPYSWSPNQKFIESNNPTEIEIRDFFYYFSKTHSAGHEIKKTIERMTCENMLFKNEIMWKKYLLSSDRVKEVMLEDLMRVAKYESGKTSIIIGILKEARVLSRTKNCDAEYEIKILSDKKAKGKIQKELLAAIQTIKSKNEKTLLSSIVFYSDLSHEQVKSGLSRMRKSDIIDFKNPYVGGITTLRSMFIDSVDFSYYQEKRDDDFSAYDDMQKFFLTNGDKIEFIKNYFIKENLDSLKIEEPEELEEQKELGEEKIKKYMSDFEQTFTMNFIEQEYSKIFG